jgi:hypothetical protein
LNRPLCLGPTTKALANAPEDVGRGDISAWTDKAFDLYGYKYRGPDPDMAFSKYARRGSWHREACGRSREARGSA